MGSSSKTSIDTATAKSLDAATDDCFEVDDIAAFDPIVAPAPAPKAKKRAKRDAVKDGAMEIELSADDMDAMLGDDVVFSTKTS